MEQIKKILLIDDDTVSCWLSQEMLKRTAFVGDVACMYDGQSAIDYLMLCCSNPVQDLSDYPDLIFLDLDMPGISGFNVLDALQNCPDCEWLIGDRIIVLTTSINHKDLERANTYHIHNFLVKPLTETKLKMVLEDFMNRNTNDITPHHHNTQPASQGPTDRKPLNKPISTATGENTQEEQAAG